MIEFNTHEKNFMAMILKKYWLEVRLKEEDVFKLDRNELMEYTKEILTINTLMDKLGMLEEVDHA